MTSKLLPTFKFNVSLALRVAPLNKASFATSIFILLALISKLWVFILSSSLATTLLPFIIVFVFSFLFVFKLLLKFWNLVEFGLFKFRV